MDDLRNEMAGGEAVSGRRESLSHTLAEALLDRITDGRMAGGSKLPPLREIAAEFEVSTMTVRQAIQTLERQGYVYRLPRVGAFVHAQRQHRRSKLSAVALAGIDLSNSFHVAIARGLQLACRRSGLGLRLVDMSVEAAEGSSPGSRFEGGGSTGVVVLPPLTSPRLIAGLREAQASGTPMVLVDQTVPGLSADLVSSDHESGGYEATRHLLDHGHRQVVMLTHPPTASSSVAGRILGYEQALRAAGIEPRANWLAQIELSVHLAGHRIGERWRGAYEAIMTVLKHLDPPVGVVGIDAYAGWGVYEAARELGLRIPQDVSVVAFDDIDVTRALRPPMTIISQRTDEIGRKAVERLELALATGSENGSVTPSCTHLVVGIDLKERESVAPASPRRPHVNNLASMKNQ